MTAQGSSYLAALVSSHKGTKLSRVAVDRRCLQHYRRKIRLVWSETISPCDSTVIHILRSPSQPGATVVALNSAADLRTYAPGMSSAALVGYPTGCCDTRPRSMTTSTKKHPKCDGAWPESPHSMS